MALTKKQLEAVSITAQNDAIALSEIYRACFKESLQNEIATAINEELSEIVQENNEVAENVIETVAVAYAKTVSKPQIKPIQVKLLRLSRDEEHQGSNVQALLPMRKPRAKAS
jgi:hypothetical protein